MALRRVALQTSVCLRSVASPLVATIQSTTRRPKAGQLSAPNDPRQMTRCLSVPAGSWDTHIHVAEPSRFPPSSKAVYKVHVATLSQAFDNAARLSVPNIVFVQTSTYGTDNKWILDCLSRVRDGEGTQQGGASSPREAFGIVVIEPDGVDAGLETLRRWDELGVRGVRLNFASVKKDVDSEQIAALLRTYADIIRPLRRWGIHMYIPLHAVPGITSALVDQLGVKIVIDHVGNPPGLAAPMGQYKGWTELLRLLEHPDVFVKVSAPYRFTDDQQFRGLEAPVKELMGVKNGEGVVFASDWPHTRFEDTDIKPWVDRCLEWCENDQALALKLFRANAERLFKTSK